MKVTKKQIEKICKRMNVDLVRFFFLARGDHNDNYVIETKENKFVLRIVNNPMFKNLLKKEYKILKSLKSDLGPKVYLFDSSHRIIPHDYLVEEFLSGKNPKRKANENFVILMARWFKKLHSTKTSGVPSCTEEGYYSLLCAIKPYFNNFKNYKNTIKNKLCKKLESLFGRALDLCKRNDKLFYRRKRFCILHRDPSKDNILIDNKKIKLIDWEFASYGVPQWDLVCFLQSYKFEKHHKKLFLDTYGYPNTKIARKKLDMIALLNICGGVGYSVWRLDLVNKGKIKKQERKKIMTRLKKDTRLFEEILQSLSLIHI